MLLLALDLKSESEHYISVFCFTFYFSLAKIPYFTDWYQSNATMCLSMKETGIREVISCFPVRYRAISVKIFFDLTLVPPVKIPIFMFLLPRLIARASQPDGNMTSFTLHFSRLT